MLPCGYTTSGPEQYKRLLRNAFCILKCILNSMGSSGKCLSCLRGRRLRSHISFITTYNFTWEHLVWSFSYITETLKTKCGRWLVTALEQVPAITQLQTALHVESVQLQCTARMSFHHARAVMSAGGDASPVGNGGRERTSGDIYIPKSSRAGQVGSSFSMFSVFGTSRRSKQTGRFSILREADHFLDTLHWSLGGSLILCSHWIFLCEWPHSISENSEF